LEFFVVANAKLQIFGDLPKGLSPFLSAQFNFLSDTNNLKWGKFDRSLGKGYEEHSNYVPAYFRLVIKAKELK